MIKRIALILYTTLALMLAASAQNLYAQEQSSLSVDNQLKLGASIVYSPDSFAAWGKIKNSRAISFRGQVWHTKMQLGRFTPRFGSELIITHRLHYPVNGINGPRDIRTGFGLVPLKMLVPFSDSGFVPFMTFSAGGIFLNDKLPAGDGASLNYLLNISTGFEIPVGNRLDLQVGYGIQHMSNGNSGTLNPGIDSHSIFFTFIFS